METKSKPRVCVVGAGISGLVTAKVLRNDGFEVIGFDKASNIGGVWISSRTYPELRTNTPREEYAFSDFPFPDTTDDFPNAKQMRSYLESYVQHFGLRDLFRFSTEVESVSRAPQTTPHSHPGFQVQVRPTDKSGEIETHHFDFVAVCNGVFSHPYVPEIDGSEHFDGSILHSSAFTDKAIVEGKRVIVVGAGKSALDCATVAAHHARSCTLLFRSPKWMIPQYFFGLRYDRLFFNRFFESHYRYHRLGPVESLMHGPLKPLLKLSWRLQSWSLEHLLLKTPSALVPDRPMPADITIGVGSDFYEVVREGRADARHAEIVSFADDGTLQLDTGEDIEADVIIFGTGWRQQVNFLDDNLRDLVQRDGFFHLYRHIIPPQEPRLGFIGYATTFMTAIVNEISAHWLSQNFRGELPLPDVEEMDQHVAHVRRWAEASLPVADEGFFLGPFSAHYIDELMRDMNLRVYRAGNPISEYFGRFLPGRYKDVGSERRAAREQLT